MRRANKKGTMKDYYSILGVAPGASEDDIKRAYRTLAMKHHPDRGGDQTQFQEIQEAYSVLSDPNKRAEWEAQKNAARFHHPGGPGGFHFNFNFGQGEAFDINDLFSNFTGGVDPFGGFRQQRRNRDLKVVIDLDLSSTLEPQKKHINVRHLNGSNKDLTIDIPRGVNNGVQMKYAGHGDHSYNDLPPGDLYIQFRVRENPEYIVEGLDLVKIVKLNCLDAITGTYKKINGLDGKEFEVSIPAGIGHGFRMRISQQGLYALDHPVRGSLIIQIELKVPTEFTAEQLALIKKISEEYKYNTGNL